MLARARDFEPYLERLRELPFVRGARVGKLPTKLAKHGLDAMLAVDTPTGAKHLPVELKRTHLSREVGEHLMNLGSVVPSLLVLAPTVGRDLGARFAAAGVNFIDLAGNCYVRLNDRYVARVQGVRVAGTAAEKGLRAPAYRVLFALLASPELANAPARTLAARADGVSPQTAIDVRSRLEARGMLLPRQGSLQWAPGGRKQALDLFVAGFAATLQPALAIGRFRVAERDIGQLESDMQRRLGRTDRWRWGGGAACQRLTRHFRGDRTLVYVDRAEPRLPARLRLLPDAGGNVSLARSPGPLAFEGPNPEAVHPLLAYADLLAEGDERSREGAGEIYERYLESEYSK